MDFISATDRLFPIMTHNRLISADVSASWSREPLLVRDPEVVDVWRLLRHVYLL